MNDEAYEQEKEPAYISEGQQGYMATTNEDDDE